MKMMSSHKPEKRKLSKWILEMKFMKRSKERAEMEEEEEEGRAAFASELTEAMRIGSNRFVIERSFVPCEDLIVGRLSFHGFNPEIERLLELEKGVVRDDDVEEGADVTKDEMAEHYSSMVETLANKFKTKKERRDECQQLPRKKMRFLKPEDD